MAGLALPPAAVWESAPLVGPTCQNLAVQPHISKHRQGPLAGSSLRDQFVGAVQSIALTNSRGVRISAPSHWRMASRALSPVTMTEAPPSRAIASKKESFGSGAAG